MSLKYMMNDRAVLALGDCCEILKTIPSESVDAIVTDPPYEISFMGRSWDAAGVAYNVAMWQECLRVLKPGGHLLSFGGTRTYHRMACAIEDAGFEVRDSIHWLYGTGFPKSRNVAIAIDKEAGAMGHRGKRVSLAGNKTQGEDLEYAVAQPKHEPITDDAKHWNGWGTALKPSHEPVVVARKPLVGNVVKNVLAHGTGALNIDGCRVGFQSDADKASAKPQGRATSKDKHIGAEPDAGNNETRIEFSVNQNAAGRWPTNILLSHTPECGNACAEDCPVAELDRQSPVSGTPKAYAPQNRDSEEGGMFGIGAGRGGGQIGDVGGASRFFPVFKYQAKAPRRERGESNNHPTVKPVALMEWLIKLVVQPDGIVLDPFMGSGTTGVAAMRCGVSFIGIEREPNYMAIAEGRILAAGSEVPGTPAEEETE